MTLLRLANVLAAGLALFVAAMAAGGAENSITVHQRSRTEQGGGWIVRETVGQWQPKQSAVIVCDMWDAHHCLNAVRRVGEVAPRMDRFLEEARGRGALIIHAPSGCMATYKDHPGRKLAQAAPKAANLPADIGQWCYKIPAEEKGVYPIDQTDGGEDDDPVEHARWHERLAGMGRNPKSPWKAETDLLTIRDGDAISDSGVEIWNLLEQRGIRNVMLVGVHTNMCVLGRPFGLRQMSKNGKNVVLVRDLTDTMYNPEKSPYVTHFVGTDRIVEHIEKYVCPTITSVDLLGGEPFRFKNDGRNILMVIGDDEYKTEVTLPAFAKAELQPHGFQVRVVHADATDKDQFPGLAEAARAADLILVSARRRTPPPDQLDAIRAHVAAGKPLVGIRTACHAFAPRAKEAVRAGRSAWAEFDPEVIGGHYTGHHGAGPQAALTIAPGAKDHPVLRGVDLARLTGHGSLYKVAPLVTSTTPLLIGSISGKDQEPVAWTNVPRVGHSRVFYTSLGHPADFESPAFRKLLLNGICWTTGIAPPGAQEQAKATGASTRGQ
jgi:type 1 glutamine amidotransferase/nicotinamidase-related amidase